MPSKPEQTLLRIYQHMPVDELKERIAGGELTPDASRLARKTLHERLGGDGLDAIPASQHEAMLVLIYAPMPSDEIKQRLASGTLIPLAASVAQGELQRRLARGERGQPRKMGLREKIARANQDQHFADMPLSMLAQVGLALLLMAVTPFMFLDWALASWICGTVLLARVLGKSFPRLARPVGWLLLSAPVIGFGAVILNIGNSPSSGIQTLFLMVVVLAMSGVPCFIGYQLLKGARHRGSWNNLEQQMAEERQALRDRLES